MTYSKELLEEKLLHNLDYRFIEIIKHKFPVNNAYFLVCLAECLYNFEDSGNNDILDTIINEAYELYNKSDISSHLREFQDGVSLTYH